MGSVGLLKDSVLVCAPLMAESVEQMLKDMNRAKAEGADVVEIRLDCIKNFQPQRDLQILLRNKTLPVITSFRAASEEGVHNSDGEVRLQVLQLASELGSDYVEFELQAASALRERDKFHQCNKSKLIVSCNVDNIASPKEDIGHLIADMQSTGADILKLVVNATNITETAKVFQLLSHSQVPLIAYITGERGFIGHVLAPKFGGFMVYGSIEGHSVPGLPTLSSLRQAYQVECIDADTKVFGLVSKPVSHSKGPLLHNPTFRHVGYNAIYIPMLVDDLKEFFNVYSSPDFAGFSVGIPYKETVLEFCDEVHPLAQSIGAVNTIIKSPKDGRLIGYNTDCEASITAIEDALTRGCRNEDGLPSPLNGKLFVLVGAGGAGRALAFGAKSRGARVVIFDIDYDRAKSLANAVSGEALPFGDLVSFQPEHGAILANATPLGMHPNTQRIPVAEVLQFTPLLYF
ncbi:OLC1v1000632C3 [Oldenlandia corymbosa var. corymbosa]|uniref:OLC1v1000632C3 n=1 Tax=Oldenlandia corymbosa var. corymbosa TaxID=529605 RepID=A0AAV1D5U1_OLDCO|nr:OLC1v1000632C3 [Oldenlandia corymbosa var. corymbosa]